MTFEEFYDMAGVVVRLRKDLEAVERLATDRERERDQARDELGPVALQLSAHVESLTLSNAQCAEYLRQNEQLTAELDRMKGDPLPIKLVGKLKDAEDSNKTLHSELVEVRSALASVTEQRDSLRRTLNEWERADTKPHERVAADDLADHVVPPGLPLCNVCHECGMPLGASAKGPYLWCTNFSCNRKTTQYRDHDASPYWGPCKSATPVRHE